jgi:Aldehyde dehydrogenase family
VSAPGGRGWHPLQLGRGRVVEYKDEPKTAGDERVIEAFSKSISLKSPIRIFTFGESSDRLEAPLPELAPQDLLFECLDRGATQVGRVGEDLGDDGAAGLSVPSELDLEKDVTNDLEQAERVADRIDAGMVYVNIVGADTAETPFGGTKRSGFGRELGRFGADEFVNKKLIRIG